MFQPFKHWHQVALHEAVQYGALEFTKQDFLANFQRIHERTFKRKTILSAWEKAGLFPFNPALVKSKIAAFQSEVVQVAPERPITPPPKPEPFQQTPTTEMHQAHMEYLKTRWVDRLCCEAPLTPSYYQALKKYEKYSSMKSLQAQLMKEREIKKSQEEQEKMRRKSGSNQHVQKNGIIYKDTAVRQIEERKKEVVNKALERLCKAKDKVWKKFQHFMVCSPV